MPYSVRTGAYFLLLTSLSLAGCGDSVPPRVVPDLPDPSAPRKAIELYDANHDGFLDAHELEAAPGLKAAWKQLDAGHRGKISEQEIADRLKDWAESRIGRLQVTCRVTHDGKPLPGVIVVFVPEKFLGGTIKSGSGTTFENGLRHDFLSLPGRPHDSGSRSRFLPRRNHQAGRNDSCQVQHGNHARRGSGQRRGLGPQRLDLQPSVLRTRCHAPDRLSREKALVVPASAGAGVPALAGAGVPALAGFALSRQPFRRRSRPWVHGAQHGARAGLRTSAFTLVELLIVISIIGVLVALTMPAVNSAREAGRRAACMNNLKQLAAGCLSHEATQGFLPSGGWAWGWAGDPNRGFNKRQPGGWHYNILPYIDQNDLHDLGKGVDDATRHALGRQAAQAPVGVFICPTRRKFQAFPHTTQSPYWLPASINEPTSVAGRSDYAANGGDDSHVDTFYQGPATLAQGDAMPDAPSPGYSGDTWAAHWGTWANGVTGVIFRRSECSFAAIKDGASFTYLIGEKYVNPDNYYTANQLGGNYYCADNEGWDEGFDYDTNRWTGTDGPGIGNPLPPRQDTRGWADNGTCDRLFGSAHASGFQMAFCDGTVRKMSYVIDPVVHQTLGNRMDGEPTQLQALETK